MTAMAEALPATDCDWRPVHFGCCQTVRSPMFVLSKVRQEGRARNRAVAGGGIQPLDKRVHFVQCKRSQSPPGRATAGFVVRLRLGWKLGSVLYFPRTSGPASKPNTCEAEPQEAQQGRFGHRLSRTSSKDVSIAHRHGIPRIAF